MKTEFELEVLNNPHHRKTAKALIIGAAPKWSPYVKINIEMDGIQEYSICVPDRDLERFAVNILKAIKSSKLK